MVIRIREYILIVGILLFAASSIAGRLQFRQGATVPTSGEKGEPLWQTTGGFNGKGQLYMGYSNASGRKAYKAYSAGMGARGADGRAPATIFVNISGGNAGYTYNKSGLLPVPPSKAYKAQFFSTPIGNTTTIIRYQWTATGHLRGNSTTSTFTPVLQGGYSSHWSTNVKVLMTYSTNYVYGAKRYIGAQVNPAITRIGATGEQGVPGQDATVTEPAVVTAFSTTASNNPLVMRTTSGTQSKFEVWDTSNAIRNWIDTTGNQYWQMANEDVVVKILTDGSFIVYRAGAIKSAQILSDRIELFRGDGSSVAFGMYSNGKYKPGHGWPASNGMCEKTNIDGSRYYEACATGGGGTETQATILAKIKESTAANQTLERKAATTDSYSSAMIRVRGSDDKWRLRVDTKGQIGVYRNGRRIFGVMTTSGGSVVVGG